MDEWEARYRDLVYAISHDVNAPVRHVIAFSELLSSEADALDAEQRGYLEHVHQSGRLLQAMIGGLLRLSRAHRNPLERSLLDVGEIAALTPETHRARIEATSGRRASVDGPRLGDAIEELVHNAEHHGGGAEVVLAETESEIEIAIVQRGPGLGEDDWARALKPLQRLGGRPEIDHVGVGLSIAEALVERMDGRLERRPDGVAIRLATEGSASD